MVNPCHPDSKHACMKDNSDSFQDSTLKVYTKYKNDLVQQNHPATRKSKTISLKDTKLT